MARLDLVRNAYLTIEGLEHTQLRPTAWWLPLVDPSGAWFDAVVAGTQARLEPLGMKPSAHKNDPVNRFGQTGGVVADDVGLGDQVDGDGRVAHRADRFHVRDDEPLAVLLVALQNRPAPAALC